jgi:hypothetical protein
VPEGSLPRVAPNLPVKVERELPQLLFTIALALSAGLLFWIQPLFGKMLLPLLGGTPSVWNTCLVFFQTALLLGYCYAHAQRRYIPPRMQIISHLCLMLVFLCLLPARVPDGWIPPAQGNPIPWLLLLLSASVGLPFVILSASAPLFQNWFSLSGELRAKDPYFLYAASNFGSLVGILGFPLIIEPRMTLANQAWLWTGGYVVLILIVVSGSALIWGRISSQQAVTLEATQGSDTSSPRMWWLLLSAVPSSLLQSVTTYVTTDLASVPLLWVIPLGLYLISFVLVFSRRQLLPHGFMIYSQPVVLLALVLGAFWFPSIGLLWMLLLNLAALFVTAMVCHGELVRLRPSTDRLTEFYLIIAAGGVIGGIFNLILAPLLFSSLMEYPIALVIAGLLIPSTKAVREKSRRLIDVAIPVAILLVLFGIVWSAETWMGIAFDRMDRAIVAIAGGVVVYLCYHHPLRFGLGLAALIVAGMYSASYDKHDSWKTVYAERNFFGILKIQSHPRFQWLRMKHNTTSHGIQIGKGKWRRAPTLYYTNIGPVGDMFRCRPPVPSGRKIAVAGLGVGTMASYAAPNDHWMFYEINPAVVNFASDPNHFTYLKDSPAKTEVILGDARLALKNAPEGYFQVILLDAFSSDSIPVHLLTREALSMYLTKLAPEGLLAFHISNRHFDLVSVLKSLAIDLHLTGLWTMHHPSADYRRSLAAVSSNWVVLARKAKDLECLVKTGRWNRLDENEEPVPRTWTDDYSNIIECLRILK